MSKKLKHTKGQWIAQGAVCKNGDECYHIVILDDSENPKSDGIIIAEVVKSDNDEGEANARLMAAAPDLLLACLAQEANDLKKAAKLLRQRAIRKAMKGVEGVSI
jgi:hypothetical protein